MNKRLFLCVACGIGASFVSAAALLGRVHAQNPVVHSFKRSFVTSYTVEAVGDSAVKTLLPQAFLLADHSRIELKAVTFGKHHQYHGEAFDVPSLLPDDPQSVNSALGLWLEAKRDPRSANTRSGIYPHNIRLYDDAGRCFKVWEATVYFKNLSDDGLLVCLPTFPRRTKQITVEMVYDDNAPIRFRIPNPTPRSAPPFRAEQTPIRRRDDELTVVLEGVHQVPPPMAWSGSMERLKKKMRLQPLETLAAFTCQVNNQPTLFWTPQESLLWDTCGNRFVGSESTLYPNNQDDGTGRGVLRGFEFYRMDNAEALRMGVWFYRTANADFAADETTVVEKVPVEFLNPDLAACPRAACKQVHILVHEVRECECVGKRTCLEIHVSDLPPHTQVLLQARDEQGRSAQGVVGSNPHSKWIPGAVINGQEEWINGKRVQNPPYKRLDFLMDVPPGATKLKLTFAINQARYFEFTPGGQN